MQALSVDGKFFRSGESRTRLRMVTYGPFPGGWPEDFTADFTAIRAAGFNAVRLYQMPPATLLEAAARHALWVFGGLEWPQSMDFLKDRRVPAAAAVAMEEALRTCEGCPALAGIFVANEIPADLVRWMGPVRVRKALEDLIAQGREMRPDLLWCYGNYPSTEYLEPENADFTAFNVYLEGEAAFRKYLRRLHHIAGDRPVLISEFGLDSRRNGLEKQAETLSWAIRTAGEEGAAGITLYAWSDRWWNAAMEILDWDFGLETRGGEAKPALEAVSRAFATEDPPGETDGFAVIVCTRNGAPRIAACLTAILKQNLPAAEVIVVDDGSTDDTAAIVAKDFPAVRLLKLAPGGLSAARNAGAEAAGSPVLAFTDDDCEPDPDWLLGLSRAFREGWDAAGGPNLPPPPRDSAAAVVAAAPGAPSHVMLTDAEAEHLPGCNIAVRRTAYFDIGGFDPVFRTAGDDVDFCWRLKDRGYRLGFAPTAFVWHHRRPSLRGYLKQQLGYGRAEALLIAKHPHRFTDRGDAKWQGFVYSGGPVRAVEGSIIYHGRMGLAGYQGVVDRMQPLRPLDPAYDNCLTQTQLRLLTWLQPRLRAWERCHRWISETTVDPVNREPVPDAEFAIWSETGTGREEYLERLLNAGWQPGGESEPWDLRKDGTRVLIATEKGDGPGRNNLFRVWGDPALLLFLRR